jgi:hypothetical protein
MVKAASPPFAITIVVTPNDLARCGPPPTSPSCAAAHSDRKWFFYDDVKDLIDNTMGSFVICQYGACPYYDGSGAAPPLGVGSAQISTVLNRRPNLATYQFGGTKLANITTLGYSFYNPVAGNKSSPFRAGYLQFNVDFTGTSTAFQRRLTFVPINNPPVLQDQWQDWDAINNGTARWTYSGTTWPLPGTPLPGGTPKTWATILSEYPNSRILPGDSFLGIRVGEPYPDGYTGNIDAFKFGTAAGTITFDFEPYGCSSGHGDGDGDFEDSDGHSHHGHFHDDSCEDGHGDVEEDDHNSGGHFKSDSVSSASFTSNPNGQALTMTGTGLHNGLPVGFTMIAVDKGDLTPGGFLLVLTDGYSTSGSLPIGAITIR